MVKRLVSWGVNAYPDPAARLNGCVNDVLAVSAMAADYGFEANPQYLLLDRMATRNAIWACLMLVREDSKPGDLVLCHWSSHGTTMEFGPELVHAACPYDYDGRLESAITSRNIASWLRGFPPGVTVELWGDSCYSGAMVDPAAKTWPMGNGVPKLYPDPYIIHGGIEHRRSLPTFRFRNAVFGAEHVAYISACGSQQFAADTIEDGKPCGAFTHFLLKELVDAPTRCVETMAAILCEDLKTNGYEQRPNAEGDGIRLPNLAGVTTP